MKLRDAKCRFGFGLRADGQNNIEEAYVRVHANLERIRSCFETEKNSKSYTHHVPLYVYLGLLCALGAPACITGPPVRPVPPSVHMYVDIMCVSPYVCTSHMDYSSTESIKLPIPKRQPMNTPVAGKYTFVEDGATASN